MTVIGPPAQAPSNDRHRGPPARRAVLWGRRRAPRAAGRGAPSQRGHPRTGPQVPSLARHRESNFSGIVPFQKVLTSYPRRAPVPGRRGKVVMNPRYPARGRPSFYAESAKVLIFKIVPFPASAPGAAVEPRRAGPDPAVSWPAGPSRPASASYPDLLSICVCFWAARRPWGSMTLQ